MKKEAKKRKIKAYLRNFLISMNEEEKKELKETIKKNLWNKD